MHRAAYNGHLETIHALLQAGGPLEAEGGADLTPLVEAARRGQIRSVQALLKAGANIDASEGVVLCYACENEDCLELIELLLKAGAKVNVTGGYYNTTPLHVATEKNQVPVARRLLEAGASITAKDSNGWTPFLNAALRSGVEMLQLLLDAGSDIKAVDHERRNAYDLASKWGKRESADFLKRLLQVR